MHELEPNCTDRLAYSLPNFCLAVDLSEDTVRKAIQRNELVPVYPTPARRKPIITREEGERWLRSLPQG